MLGPLFGWLFFSSEAGTDDATLNCRQEESSSPANFTNICSSPIKCKSSFSLEQRDTEPGRTLDGCHNKLIYTCKKSTFNFRPVAITRRTEALASVEVSCIFSSALSRFSSKQPQQEQQKSKWIHLNAFYALNSTKKPHDNFRACMM